MGTKLEKNKSIVREGKTQSEVARDLGKQAIEQVEQVAGIVDSLPDDVDDEISASFVRMKEAVKRDSIQYMEHEVGDRARDAQEKLGEAQAESRKQIEKNKEAESGIGRIESISKFGEDGRRQALSDIRHSTEQFEEIADEAQNASRETEETLRQQTAQIRTLI